MGVTYQAEAAEVVLRDPDQQLDLLLQSAVPGVQGQGSAENLCFRYLALLVYLQARHRRCCALAGSTPAKTLICVLQIFWLNQHFDEINAVLT